MKKYLIAIPLVATLAACETTGQNTAAGALAGAAIGGARRTYKHTDQNAPLRSNATLDAVGATAVYLCSDGGACTSGQVIMVDGGYNIMGMPRLENL